MKKKTVKKVTTVIAASAVAASTMITPVIAAGQSAADDEDGKQQNQQQNKGKAAASNIKEAKIQLEAARCASCNCMTYFYCAPLQVYTPFRSAQNHCPPDNVRPAGGYIMQMYNIVLLRTSVNLRFFVPNHSIISCTSHSVFLFIHMLLVCCLFFRLHDLY